MLTTLMNSKKNHPREEEVIQILNSITQMILNSSALLEKSGEMKKYLKNQQN